MDGKCPFLQLNSGFFSSTYRCAKKNEDVLTGSSLYENYCKWSDSRKHEQCPYFKPQSSDGGCFLTSACVEAMGKADDCEELTILRAYRDGWLAAQPGGKEEIDEYYRIAPQIVNKIKLSEKAQEVFAHIYNDMVRPCVELIKEKRYEAAYVTYKEQTALLASKYLYKR